MCGLPLRGSSKQTVYVDSRPEEERSRLLLPKHQLQELDDENTNIFCSNAFDRYRNRPSVPEFESITFASSLLSNKLTMCKKNISNCA
jgi:hypothetical protein